MSGYTLTYKGDLAPALTNGSAIRPDTLGVLDATALANFAIGRGRRPLRVGDAFAIDGEPGESLTVCGVPPLDQLGARMENGCLIVDADAGDDLGASMRGGLIHVRGRAGHRVGGPVPGSDRGMTSGQISIERGAGAYLGLRMRGGLICVGGPCGASPGYRMMAGTIVLACGPVDHPGLEMRRGTIICLDAVHDVSIGANFGEDGRFDAAQMTALHLIAVQLGALNIGGGEALRRGSFCLLSGDRFELNKGEVWLRLP